MGVEILNLSNLWKWAEAKVWQIVVDLLTNFLCVLMVLCLFTGCEESQYDAILSQSMIYLRVGSGPVALGSAKHWPRTLAINSKRVGYWPWHAELWLLKIDMQETVPRFEAIPAGLGRKAILLINGEFRAETTRCLKCDHLLHDGSVRLDFMTDDVNEAEEMRIQTVADTLDTFSTKYCDLFSSSLSPSSRAS